MNGDPEVVSAVVVGGGLLGTGVAYHLGRLGIPDVTVLEAQVRGAGATGGSMGNVRQQGYGTELEIECSRRGLDFWKNVESELGYPCIFHEDGFLMLTANEESARTFEQQAQMQRRLGLPDVELLGRSEIADVVPFLDTTGLVCGSYTPRDGHVMAMDGVAAYLEAGRDLGVTIREHWPVDAIERTSGGWLVRGPEDLRAEIVVIAAGGGSRDLVAPFGLDLDLRNVPHRNLITEPAFPGQRIPTTIDIDLGLTVERDGDALILAMTGRNPPPRDHEHLVELFVAAAAVRAPSLTELGVVKHLTWYPQVGGDDMPYVGQIEEDLWMVAFTGHGVMHGPPVAEALARQVVGNPDPSLDMTMWDPRRVPGEPTVLWRRERQD